MCEHCKMRFSQKGNLDKHTEMIHMGVAKFRCPHCDKHFTKKFNLQVHLRNIENKLSQSKDDQKKKEALKIKGYLMNLDKKK